MFNNRTGGGIYGADTADLDHQSTCEHDDIWANNIVYGNASDTIQLVGDCIGTGNIGTNNLTGVNPQFVNYMQNGKGDYHLRSGSPAIGIGTATYGQKKDYDGVTYAPKPAAGAYEYKYSRPLPLTNRLK